jgi:hypothetical protein
MSDSNYNSDPRAKSAEGFIVGLNIFAKYWEKGLATRYFMGGEHDEVTIYNLSLEDIPLKSEDGQMLDALGFFADESEDCWKFFT